MFVFENGEMIRQDEIVINNDKKQIIFTSPNNKTLLTWLKSLQLPEYFFEDITNEDQSVSYDDWGDLQLITVKYIYFQEDEFLLYDEENISLLIMKNKLIFLSDNKDVIVEISKKFQKRVKKTDSIELAIYRILDILVDNAMLMIDVIDETLESLEDDILAGEVEEEEVQKSIYNTRRTLNRISKLFIQETDIINKIYHDFTPKTKKELKYEFIDLKEHAKFLINESKTMLDRTGYLLNVHMGILSNRMNQAMQRLAAISIIFMPLTFIVGNYGMNFKYMPELDMKYGYLGVTLANAFIAGAIFVWLKKKKWI
ncbi:MAG: magnesium transporter CorA family protein [Epsilonproteobacteria bacterium]|nr:magnesium transporter CorA family protein [Campylobacterota bacterium]